MFYYLTFNPPPSNVSITNCSRGVPWIWKVMGDCVVNDHEIASTYLGLLSILVWMICGIPQMIKNCRNLNGMAGISFLLMFQWLLGDTTNLIGSILTKQLKVQIYVAVWYVTADIILLFQYAAYRLKQRKLSIIGKSVQAVLCIGGLFLLGGTKSLQQLSPLAEPTSFHHPSGRNLLMTSGSEHFGHMYLFKNNIELTGYIIGVLSALFYVGSRFSQIYTNYVLKSTEGLSKLMFFLAILGNLLYGLAIVVRNINEVFLIKHLPWIIGSLGIIFLDVTLLCQFYYYERQHNNRFSQVALLKEDQVESSQDPCFIE